MKIILTETQINFLKGIIINEQSDSNLQNNPLIKKLSGASKEDIANLFGGGLPANLMGGNNVAKKDATNVVNNKPVDFKLTISPLAVDTVVTSGFGHRNVKTNSLASTNHKGIDLRAVSGTKIVSPADGVVEVANYNSGKCGGMIQINHGQYSTKYCHVKQIKVSKGDNIKKGQEVGLSGGGINDYGRGNSNKQHLHFEVLAGGNNVDPLTVMPFLRKA